MSTHGKVWFVTGTSSGFGRAIAEELIARGDRLVATARDPKVLQDLVATAPERVLALRLDVTKADEIATAISKALERFGQVDVLVNNAGYSVLGAVEETTDAELRTAFETMFFGVVAVTRAVLPHMRESRAGTIVQITSVGGLATAPGFGAYCAVKHGIEGLSECLAVEVAPFGIRVLIVDAWRVSNEPLRRRLPHAPGDRGLRTERRPHPRLRHEQRWQAGGRSGEGGTRDHRRGECGRADASAAPRHRRGDVDSKQAGVVGSGGRPHRRHRQGHRVRRRLMPKVGAMAVAAFERLATLAGARRSLAERRKRDRRLVLRSRRT